MVQQLRICVTDMWLYVKYDNQNMPNESSVHFEYIEFREYILYRPRNQFPPIHGIPSNSTLTQFPKFCTGIGPRPHPHASCCGQRLVHSVRVQFRYGIPGICWIRNQLRLQKLNRIPELRGIHGNQWDFIGTEFRVLVWTDSAMINIAE